jgi:urease accessory protein
MPKPSLSFFVARAVRTPVLYALVAACLPLSVWAHPGHGASGFGFLTGLLHVMHGLDHVLAAGAVGVWAARLEGRALWILPAAFVAAMGLGIGVAAAGVRLPAVEPALAASVLLLGALIATDARFSAALGALLVAAVAPFHGAAHWDAAMTGPSLGFALGVLLSTVMLHAAGVLAARTLKAHPLWLRLAAAPVALAGMAMLLLPAG